MAEKLFCYFSILIFTRQSDRERNLRALRVPCKRERQRLTTEQAMVKLSRERERGRAPGRKWQRTRRDEAAADLERLLSRGGESERERESERSYDG